MATKALIFVALALFVLGTARAQDAVAAGLMTDWPWWGAPVTTPGPAPKPSPPPPPTPGVPSAPADQDHNSDYTANATTNVAKIMATKFALWKQWSANTGAWKWPGGPRVAVVLNQTVTAVRWQVSYRFAVFNPDAAAGSVISVGGLNTKLYQEWEWAQPLYNSVLKPVKTLPAGK